MSADKEKKTFVIREVFTDIEKDRWDEGRVKRHFKAGWQICISQTKSFSPAEVTLNCIKDYEEDDEEKWKIDTTIETKLLTNDGEKVLVKNHIFTEDEEEATTEIEENEFTKYLVNGNLSIECKVTIHEMTGFERPNKRNFDDESAKEFSDVVLIVKEKKFYVSKLYLAAHSLYFKSLLMGSFDESKQSEIELKDIDPNDFQKFLEVLYGEYVFDNDNIGGILHLADMYDAKTVIGHCERFLRGSSLELADKFILASRYKLEKLKRKYMGFIDTVKEIEEILEEDEAGRVAFEDWKELLKLSISIHKKK